MTSTPKKVNAALSKAIASAPQMTNAIWAHVDEIEGNPFQYRPEINPESPNNLDLRDSIVEHGILQPMPARLSKDKTHKGVKYQLMAGHRRWEMSKEAEKIDPQRAWVPLVIGEYSDIQAAEIALLENVQREDPSDMATAEGIKTMMDLSAEHGEPLSEREVARRLKKRSEDGTETHFTVSYVRNKLGLLKLRPQLKEVARRRDEVSSSLFEIQKVNDPGLERELIAQVDQPKNKRAGFQRIKAQVEAYLEEEERKKESSKPHASGLKGLKERTARQREAQQESKRLALEITGKIVSLQSYAGSVGEEYFENELAPRIAQWQLQLKSSHKEKAPSALTLRAPRRRGYKRFYMETKVLKTRMKKRGHIVTIHSLDTKGIIPGPVLTPAQRARIAAGFPTVAQLAKRMRLTARTVHRYETRGGAPDDFMRKWAMHTKASGMLVFHSPQYLEKLEEQRGTPQGAAGLRSVPTVALLPPITLKRSPTRAGRR